MSAKACNSYQHEIDFLVNVTKASIDDDSSNGIETIKNNIDWSVVVALAHAHQIAPLVHCRLRDLKVQPPAEASAILKRNYQESVVNSLRVQSELRRLSKAIEEQSIPFLVWKGPELAQRAFPEDVGRRPYSDLDLLVDPTDWPDVRKIVQSLGYEPQFPLDPRLHSSLFASDQYCWYFVEPRIGLELELHWRFSSRNFPLALTFQDAWQSRVLLEFDNLSLPVLSIENEVLTLCHHASKHRWERLLWINELMRLCRNAPESDWNMIKHLAAQYDCDRMLALADSLAMRLYCKTLFPEKTPPRIDPPTIKILEKTLSHLVKEMPSPNHGGHLSLTKYRVAIRKRLRNKIAFIDLYLLPKKRDFSTIYLPPGLRWLYAPIRLARLLFSALKI
jgi:hypothetical protein